MSITTRVSSLQVQPRESQAQCPLCREPLDEAAVGCVGCGTELHLDCAEELGGCPTLGCSHKGSASPPAVRLDPRAAPERARDQARVDSAARDANADRLKAHGVGVLFLGLHAAFLLYVGLTQGRLGPALGSLPFFLLAAVTAYTTRPRHERRGPRWAERAVWLTCTGLRAGISGFLGLLGLSLVGVVLSVLVDASRGEDAPPSGAAVGVLFAAGCAWLARWVWRLGAWPRRDDWPG